ncbi:MAG: uracil-DNA glycosylase family protein [Candidatus Aenigmatarchaeota archaeon]
MNLEKLQNDIRNCKICKDLPKDSKPLFHGNSNAKIVIVSQAPSKLANQLRRKWADNKSGKIFKSWLNVPEEIFYNENIFYITSLGKCYPGKEKGGDRKPNPICASKWLTKELRLLKPELIITVGKQSFSWFFPDKKDKYDKFLNGKTLRWKSIEVFPLPHPSGANNAWKVRNKKRLDVIILNLREKLNKILQNQNGKPKGF